MSFGRLRSNWTRHARGFATQNQYKNALERRAPIDIHPEVEDALVNNKPVVALETTVITHGLPHPQNHLLGRSLENIVRSTGSVPATIGVIGGRIKIGLEENELQRLAEKTHKPVKLSRRDLAAAIATKADGGTTCSATLLFAALAGIRVFSTGGLGGVHRGGERSMDVSPDLVELSKSPVGLVSAGVKSILDIGRTLEYLETLGVPVISYSRSREFPAFFTRRSGFEVPWNVSDPLTAANILYTQWQLGMNNGALIAVPVPEEYEEMGSKIQDAVDQAVAESEQNGISSRGQEATPWLLQRVSELTNQESLATNIALLENTAKIGGQIAVHYHRLLDEQKVSPTSVFLARNQTMIRDKQDDALSARDAPLEVLPDMIRIKDHIPPSSPTKLAVIGSAAVDITANAVLANSTSLGRHSTMPGTVSLTFGGVARNIAEAAHRVLASIPRGPQYPLLISPVGLDPFGGLLISETKAIGMRTDGVLRSSSDQRTAVCNMMLDNKGELMSGIADMGITETFGPEEILPILDKAKPNIVAMDGNLSSTTLTAVVKHCVQQGIKVLFEPTSVVKSTSILPAIASCLDLCTAPITYATPNVLELSHLYQAARSEPNDLMSHSTWWSSIDSFSLATAYRTDLEQLAKRMACDQDSSKGTLTFLLDQGIAQMAVNLLPFFQHLIIKCGERGVLVAMHIGRPSAWSHERSNILRRYIVAQASSGSVVLQHFPAHLVRDIINVTGAGDSFVGALLAVITQEPGTFGDHNLLAKAIAASQQAARLTLQSHLAVSPTISYHSIMENN